MDYDVLNNFVVNAISYASKISAKYKELELLELNGLLNVPLYNNKTIELRNLIDCENNFFNSFEFNDEEIEYMLSFISYNYSVDENESLEEILHFQKNDFNPAYRLYFKLNSSLENCFETCEDEIDEEEVIKHIKFQRNLLKNYCLVLESFVNSYLKSEQNFRNELLYIKYLLPFLNSEIEKEFIKDFKFKEELYLDFKMFGDAFGISDIIQKQYISLQFLDKFVDEINKVLEINDRYFFENEKKILISEIIIKSIAVFFSSTFIKELLVDLNEHIIENAVCFCDNQLAVQNIFNLKEITKKDKEKFAYLSLKLPRN